MRLPRFPAGLLGALVNDGQPATATPGGGANHPLQGSWSATRWQYTSQGLPERCLDVVCDLGGTVTLSLSAGTYVLTCEVTGRGHHSVGGAYSVRDEHLEFFALGSEGKETLGFRLGAEALSLRCEESACDFEGDGREQPAEFVAVFVRL